MPVLHSGNIEGVLAASRMCIWELPGSMLYPVAAVAFIALLLRCFWRFLFTYPDVLVGRDLWVVAALSEQPDCIGRIKPQEPLQWCLFFFHTSIRMAGPVASLAPSPPLPPPPLGCQQPVSKPALPCAVLRCCYCALCTKFLGLKPSLVCAVRPGNQKCTRCQELGSKCLCVHVLASLSVAC